MKKRKISNEKENNTGEKKRTMTEKMNMNRNNEKRRRIVRRPTVSV